MAGRSKAASPRGKKEPPCNPIQAAYPATRFRRTAPHGRAARLTQENTLTVGDLIWPVFLRDGRGVEPIASMPGVERLSLDLVVARGGEAADLGIPAICLFPYTDPALKTADCEEAWNPDNLTNRAIRAIKAEVPEVAVMTDVALDPYNAHGHDGLVRRTA
jgi:porphobilinogen synthase